MIEATLPAFDLSRTLDPLLAALAGRGEATSQVLTEPDGSRLDTGQLRVDPGHRLVRADGSAAPRRFALGMHTTVKAAAVRPALQQRPRAPPQRLGRPNAARPAPRRRPPPSTPTRPPR